MAKRRTKRKYFTKVHEDAIVEYCRTSDRYKKEKLYIEFIHPAFDELVDKIIYTYKFTTLPNIDYLREECKAWLVTILDKYDPDKGSKAFSYFSVVTKNWFIHKVKKTTKRLKTETQIEESKNLEHPLTDEIPYEAERARAEFFSHLRHNIDEWYEAAEKENEVKVINAIKVLFEHSDQIEIFNKKAIYLYMREITDLNTKQIATVLTKLKVRYRGFRSDWNDGEI
jgi:DNA-directed RNA polymerase specialized sigma subunit|tara:strand:+ start:80 stop:757 length:678 start_codon:yes stop_codon:yes gene_type:complete